MNTAAQPDNLGLIYQRHSVRSDTPEKITQVKTNRMLRAAVQAPTAMHRESWAFAVIQNQDTLQRYSERAKALLLQQPSLAGAPAEAALSRHERLMDPGFNIFYGAGTLVVICRKSGATFADTDCWLAAGNLMLAAVAEGLGSCCIGLALPALNTAEVHRELGIPEAGAAAVAIIVGVPSGPATLTDRKSPELLCWLT